MLYYKKDMSARTLSSKTLIRGIAVLETLSLFMVFGTAHGAQASPAPLNGTIVSWSADTYAPPGFRGKHLPTSGSNLSAWITVFAGGKPVNASDYTVRWYADNQLVQSGLGLTTISLNAPKITAKIVMLQARAQSPSGDLSVANIQIPVIDPVVALQTNYPGGIVTTPTVNAKALLYFFNVSDPSSLAFSWSANGTTGQNTENPDTATINLGANTPGGTNIRIKVTVSNPGDSTTATANANLIYQ